LPYFVSLIKQNKKLAVTHPEMTRFLLPLPDAVDLVLFALINGENGHMYVRRSPACTISILAQAACKIFNYKNGYTEVGIRSGEKMHETLVSGEERLRAVDAVSYYNIPPESQGLDYNKYFLRGDKLDMDKAHAYTSENTERLNLDQTIKLLLTLPEIQTELSL
jgi:UDP-glucose 4-epimerase